MKKKLRRMAVGDMTTGQVVANTMWCVFCLLGVAVVLRVLPWILGI